MVFDAIDHWLGNKDDMAAVRSITNAISEYADVLLPPPFPSDNFYKKYSIGTFGMMGYGYFCPSPMMDVVVDNAKRGRLVNTAKKYSHIYYFDDGSNLRCIDAVGENLSLISRSWLFRQEATEILPMWTYNKKGDCRGLFGITFAKYEEGKLRYFVVAEINAEFMDLWIEDYQWASRKMVLDKIFVTPGRFIYAEDTLQEFKTRTMDYSCKRNRSEWELQ